MSPKAKTTDYTEHHIKECAGCGKPFRTTFDTNVCGEFRCIALTTWTEERWNGHLRMAEARAATGIPLSALDFDAYERAGKAIPW